MADQLPSEEKLAAAQEMKDPPKDEKALIEDMLGVWNDQGLGYAKKIELLDKEGYDLRPVKWGDHSNDDASHLVRHPDMAEDNEWFFLMRENSPNLDSGIVYSHDRVDVEGNVYGDDDIKNREAKGWYLRVVRTIEPARLTLNDQSELMQQLIYSDNKTENLKAERALRDYFNRDDHGESEGYRAIKGKILIKKTRIHK